jgi:hypothetical protein
MAADLALGGVERVYQARLARLASDRDPLDLAHVDLIGPPVVEAGGG